MARSENILRQLQQQPSDRTGEIRVTEGPLQAHVTLADWDRLACLLERLEIRPAPGHPPRYEPASIEDTVTYLGEALKIIETDVATGRALLRSVPPCVDGGKITFFEMILDRSEGLSLARYSYDPERGEREIVAVPLTRHTLGRLLADLMELAPGG